MTKIKAIGSSETLGEKDGVKMVISRSGWVGTFATWNWTGNGLYLFELIKSFFHDFRHKRKDRTLIIYFGAKPYSMLF